jgi:cation diffusion facilitator CzcD-associated flavoprotein CzcO
MESFAGALFHSSRWDPDVPLDGRRIGVIGTGSTAVQITSALAARAGHYTLFQRTAQWIMPQVNPAYTPEEQAAWRAAPESLTQIHDSLAEAFGEFARAVIDAKSAEIQWIEEQCRTNLEQQVRDPELRESLRPDYRAACKRLVISPDFYAAIQEPHAELVTERIERIEPDGVRTTDGRLHELDVLVLATGFRADAFMRPMAVVGRDGLDLATAWRDRPSAYLSITIPGFPNLFMLNGPNGPVGNFSLIEVAELQMGYVLGLLERLRSGGVAEISPTRRATEELEAARVEAARDTVWVTGCRSWYLDDRGIPATWPWSFDRFRDAMRAPDPVAFVVVGRERAGR